MPLPVPCSPRPDLCFTDPPHPATDKQTKHQDAQECLRESGVDKFDYCKEPPFTLTKDMNRTIADQMDTIAWDGSTCPAVVEVTTSEILFAAEALAFRTLIGFDIDWNIQRTASPFPCNGMVPPVCLPW